MRLFMRSLIGAALLLTPIVAEAETLTIGTRTPPTTLDPQVSFLTSNIGYFLNVYSTLFDRDPITLSSKPLLADSIKRVDTLTWEVTLRTDVVFQNGQPFTAKDVLYSWARLRTVPNSDRLQFSLLSVISGLDAIDDFHLKITTSRPAPDISERLSNFVIICRCVEGFADTEDFNAGKAVIGTGPYRLVEWKRGEQITLSANPKYFNGAPEFDKVVLRFMANDASRVAALRAGDVDAIDFVPPADIKSISADPKLKIVSTESTRTIFFPVNVIDDAAPLTFDANGEKLKSNPFKDVRVRRALTISIDRNAIASRIMEGAATPVYQGVTRTSDFAIDIDATKPNVAQAKQLLNEAGFPKGFTFTLGCPNDRYVNDADVCQAIAQMWSRVGFVVKVEVMPAAIYFKRAVAREFPVYMLGWGRTGKAEPSFLTEVLTTKDPKAGRGSYNASYSNPGFDVVVARGLEADGASERNGFFKEAMKVALDDVAYIPSHAQLYVIATKSNLSATPSALEMTPACTYTRRAN
jgi:peptide/nickel transport system substrate-binding protein